MSTKPVEVSVDKGHRRIALRSPVAEDESYVARTWVSSMLDDRHIHGREEIKTLNETVNRLLDDKATRVLIACEPMDRDRIVGWVAYNVAPGARVLLYVNVRHQDRKQGIGNAMLDHVGLRANGTPVLYLFAGPAASWATKKRPDAVKVEIKDYLA